jgi:hypothetical protein
MIIIRDTREKEPWNLSFFPDVKEYRTQGLKTGDYTMWGYQDIVSIERKRNTSEIAINLGKKWKTFEKELKRLEPIPYKYIICEFPESDLDIFPENSGVPKKLWPTLRMSSGFLKMRLYTETIKYNIQLIFSANKSEAEQKVIEIFKEVLKTYE